MPNTFINKKYIDLNQGYIPRLKLELFGRWDETIKILQKLSPEIKAASIKAQMKVGNQIALKVKAHLRNQDLGWKPLSPDYADSKSKKGLGTKTLYSYGAYYDAIEVWVSGNRHLINIGVRAGMYTKDLRGKKSKLEIAKIAAVHEFSNGKKIPRRPLWNPTIAEIGGVKGIKKMYINSLVYHLSQAGIPVSQFRKIL